MTLRIKQYGKVVEPPKEFKVVIAAFNDWLNDPNEDKAWDIEDKDENDFYNDYHHASRHEYDGEVEWIAGSNFEDGSDSCVLKEDGKWYYRERRNGTDRPIPGGMNEAIAQLIGIINP